jgi:anhydro-N-acetylmuramic acid kinase
MNQQSNSEYYAIGLMSGTSLDGLDMAYCHFRRDDGKWFFRILAAETAPYPPEWKRRLAGAETASALEYAKTHVEFGHLMGRLVRDFVERRQLTVDFIASHGQTIFHQPEIGFTAQIGDGNALAAETALPVICDFRTLDVALGGQGAPLVPVGDNALFHEYDFCLNLGGFSNISFQETGIRVAFDISPCNMALNELAGELGLDHDPDGANARSGKVDGTLLDALNSLDFYHRTGPKSLGREWYLGHFRPLIEAVHISVPDKLCTVTEHIAYQVAGAVAAKPPGKIIVTGGGAFNVFLIERMQAQTHHAVIVPDELLINYKEALIFAFLGVLRMRQEINCLPAVTGARQACSGGSIMGIVPAANS